MNKQIYRLVFSKHLGMLVPASEAAHSHTCKSSGSRLRSRRRLLAAMLAAVSVQAVAAQPSGLVPHPTKAWTNAHIDAARTSATRMTIRQTASKAYLNWQKLNLNKGETLTFDQQGNRSWAALNRIYDQDPSVIAGQVNADGHLYFINANGIVFADGAQVNVGSLTAGSLDVTDAMFEAGILSNPAAYAFSGTGGFVQVEHGASITTASGGRVMLLAPEVTNSGVISTPDGQTILAAGKQVYLTTDSDSDVAGLLVEVNSGGKAINVGDIVAKRGNVTLVGLAVNQEGRVTASTSVRANGTVRLLARDTVSTATGQPVAQNGGVVTLGKGSVTQVEVETGDTEEVLPSQKLGASMVEMSGGVVSIDGRVIAHGGKVSAVAAFNPSNTNQDKTADSAVTATRVYLGKNALIDVSGVDATAPMSRNQLAIQLYSEQLKDTPLLRGTDWVGKTIYVDKRKGTDLVSDDALTAAEALKGQTIAERMSQGGTVNFNAEKGDVVMHAGSGIDVSGGSIAYEAGYIRESKLVYNGKTIAVSEANRNTPYERLADEFSRNSIKWNQTRTWKGAASKGRYNASYVDGSNAGTLTVSATNAILEGNLTAETQAGSQQRENLPTGGTFNFKLLTSSAVPNVRIVQDVAGTLGSSFTAVGAYAEDDDVFETGTALTNSEVRLATDMFDNGFSNLNLDALSGTINVDAAIKTTPGGSVVMKTDGRANVNADIVSPGGTIAITGGDTAIARHVTLSASGLYTNDLPGANGTGSDAVVIDGGSVSVVEKDDNKNGLTLGDGVVIEANAGAWVKAGGKVSGGDGGSVTLQGVTGLAGVDVSAYGFDHRGTLTMTAFGDLQAGGRNPSDSGTLWLSEGFFDQGGFSSYTLKTSLVDSSILVGDAAGSVTEIHPQTMVLALDSGYRSQASGTAINEVASPTLPEAHLRDAASVSFVSGGTLTIDENATIRTDVPGSGKGAAVALESSGQMNIMGDVIAPGGSISAKVSGKMATLPYDSSTSLFIGEASMLSAAGDYVATPSSDGILHARVVDAGSITLDGGERAVVVLKQGSVLDVSGSSGEADVLSGIGYQHKTLDGAAGDIAITARNGMVLDGDMHAAATGTGRDGSLTLKFTGEDDTSSGFNNPNGGRVLTVTQNKQVLGGGLQAGDALDAVTGSGQISAKQIAQAGFGSVMLDVDRNIDGDKVVLSDGVNLKVQDSLTVRTGQLEVADDGDAVMSSRYVRLGTDGTAGTPVAGDGSLKVNAEYIDLVGYAAVSGVNRTSLSASKDIRMRGKAATVEGSLTVPGTLALSARQIYPATAAYFLLEAAGNNSRIEISRSGLSPTSVLSAGGRLTMKADDIVQGGTLLAPMGQIVLDADNNLTLASGSLTSVSASGMLIPYGLTSLGGLGWYVPTDSIDASTTTDGITALPEKKIALRSTNVDMQDGATVNLSGGGDLLAYEWIEGIGGSGDKLGQSGVYAVLPGLTDGFAPFDYNYQRVRGTYNETAKSYESSDRTDIKVGDAIHLSGIDGLAEGTYTLLPARYALLPGAYMVQTASGKNLQAGSSLAQTDGSYLVNGYRLNGGARDALDSVYQVTSGSIFRPAAGTVSKAPSEYRLSTANGFFTNLASDAGTDVPRLAADAGQVVIEAGNSLALNADIVTAKPGGARGALVDIVSDKISVVSAVGADDGSLQLKADSLNALDAESLLLGGSRTKTSDGYSITTSATSVAFTNDANHALEVTELIAAASDAVTVADGATIRTGQSSTTAGTKNLKANGDGALLAVSALNDLEFSRSGVSNSAGTLTVAEGASVAAGRSMVLDATAASSLQGNADIAEGGTVTLGANRVILGEADASVGGLHVSDALLASFGELSGVTLNSYRNVDVYGPVSLGNSNLNLTMNAGGVAGHTADNQVATLTARNFTLKNSLNAAYESASAAAGSTLNVNAENIYLAGGSTATATTVGGFDRVNLNAAKEVVFSGKGSTTVNAAQTNIASSRITAASGTDFTLTAAGNLATAQVANAAVLTNVAGLGAKLTLAATDLTVGGKVELPSGNFTAKATSGDVNISSDAIVKAASVPVSFDKYVEYTPGGTVILQADAGNVNVNAGATVSVDGAGDADAGTLKVSAKSGTATVEGTLSGTGGSNGGASGSFELDAGTLADFGALNDKLNAGGFAKSREIRVRSGNVAIAADDVVHASNVIVSADAGSLTVAGKIDASAAKGGMVGLYGGTGATLTGTIDASSSNAGAAGGTVEIATSSGYLDLQSGSSIDVSGGAGGDGGEVRLRAPRTADNKDIQITAVASTIDGASTIRAEGFKTYTDNSISTADVSTTGAATSWYKEAESFMKSALVDGSYGLGRLGKSGDAIFTIVPGLEIRNAAGDVALANDWSLHNWRFDRDTGVGVTTAANLTSGQDADGHNLLSGVLTLRASGNLKLDNTLSDGFSSATLTTANTAQGISAWSYNLVAGADFNAANYRDVNTSGTGNVVLANSKGIRTGAGDINIAAGGSLTMGNEASVIYTAGRKADVLAGFDVPTNALYMADGGDISIDVKGDIVGKVGSNGAQQTVNNWLFRQGGGTNSKQVSWWVRPDLFKQGVATLGGGDVNVSAGGSVTNFSASAATTARYVAMDNYVVNGGGDVTISAGENIYSGIYFAGLGNIRINAGGEILSSSNTFGTTIALMDASAEVSAIKSALIETVFNPTLWAQSSTNAGNQFSLAGDSSFYLTYGADSALHIDSLTGDVTLGLDKNKAESITKTTNLVTLSGMTNTMPALEIHPGSVDVRAFSGDINVNRLVLAPAAKGNLSLLASGSVNGSSVIAISDADLAIMPSISDPFESASTTLSTTLKSFQTAHAATPVHEGDEESVAIVAREGSITLKGALSGDTTGPGLASPKAAYINAGQDIILNASIQHLDNRDISVIEAGRDLIMPTGTVDQDVQIRVAGPGELLVKAGRHVNLGTSQGIVTVANADNANLSDMGASISLLAGVGSAGAKVDQYISTYIAPTGSGPAALQGDAAALAAYRSETAQAVADYMRKLTGNSGLGTTEAMTQYLALDADRKAVFAYRHFSSELLATGKTFSTTGSYARGDNAIATLFPAGSGYDGNLSLYNSQIRTLKDGSVDILAPGGLVNVGVPTSSGTDIGIVTEKGGDIRVFSESGFQVEQSKVITQYGSDITVWVNNGDIDAGRGSKTALSIPERVVSTDKDGNTTIEVKGASAGSGIRAQTYDPDGPTGSKAAPALGDVALMAPRGILNAGEAGIAAGNFLGLANEFQNLSNLDVAGSSSGVPVADTTSLSASLAGTPDAASDATKAASDDVSRQIAQTPVVPQNFLPSFVSVEVIGLGF